MTHDDAKELLGATRPDDERLALEAGDVEVCTAFEALRDDAALREWYAGECALDEVIGARLRAALVVPPQSLREQILATMAAAANPERVVTMGRRSIPLWSWGAIAASMVLLGVVGWGMRDGWFSRPTTEVTKGEAAPTVPGSLEFVSFRESMSDYANGKIKLSTRDEDTVALVHWANDNAGPVFESLPEKLSGLPGIGCTVIDWDGQKVSLFCFRSTKSGNVAHLFVISRQAFQELPRDSALRVPEVCCGLESVAWNDESRVYLLVAHSPNLPVSEFF